jgi:hypothetical protein
MTLDVGVCMKDYVSRADVAAIVGDEYATRPVTVADVVENMRIGRVFRRLCDVPVDAELLIEEDCEYNLLVTS